MKAKGETKKYVFLITPQTHVRATQGDRVLFRIPEERRSPASTKRVKRLIKYNEYKVAVSAIAKKQRFKLPDEGCGIRFFVPMPKTWRKKKREIMKNTLHKQRVDLDNYLKALLDSLFFEDKTVAHLSEVSKYWVDSERGWIEFYCRPFVPAVIETPYKTTPIK